jgi:L-lactate utilization protein LutB
MKAGFLYLLFIFIIFSCNNSAKNEEQTKEPIHEQHTNEILGDSLRLNQGKKWKSDAITNENITSFQRIAEQAKQIKDPGIKEYNEAGARMQKQLDKLISECRMKGPDHEALHKWLAPLFTSVSSLVKSQDKIEASQLIDKIHSYVNSYAKYFE